MDSSASSESTVTADLGALLESTMTLSRGLETLYSEHEVLLEALGASGETSKTSLDSSTGRKRTRFFASWSLFPPPQSRVKRAGEMRTCPRTLVCR